MVGSKIISVLTVGPLPPPISGQSVAFKMLVDGLPRDDYRVTTIDITARAAKTTFLSRSLEYLGAWRQQLSSLIFDKIDIVYLTIAQSRSGLLRDLLVALTAALFRKKLVLHLHGGNYGAFYDKAPSTLRWMIRVLLRSASRIVVLGESLRPMFDFYPGIASKVIAIPNGLPTADPCVPAKSLPAAASAGRIRILYLSNMIPSKGYLVALETVARLVKSDHDVEIHFCGEFLTGVESNDTVVSKDEQMREFQNTVARLGIDGRVRFLGTVSGDIKTEQLLKAHFLILPTRYENEGQPVCLIEALAFGCVGLSTNYRAIPEIIQDGVSGILCDAPNVAEFYARTHELLGDKSGVTYRAMSQSALRHYRENFTLEAHVAKFDRLLKQVHTAP